MFLPESLQDQVLLLNMSVGTAQAPPVFLFIGTKFQLHIKTVSYCITQLPTDCTTIIFFHKQWLWMHQQLKRH